MAQKLDESERRDWLRLARTEHVGPVTFASLIARFGSARAAIAELPRLARRGGAEKFQLPPDGEAEDEIEQLDRLGGRMIASCEADFPKGLAALEPPPPIISVLGHTHFLARDDRDCRRAQCFGAGAQIHIPAGARSGPGWAGGRVGPGARHRHFCA